MRIRVAAYGVIIKDGQILLAHWNEYGRNGWTLPGGGVEAGEDPHDAVLREIGEETGYVAELDQLLGIDTMVIKPKGRRRRRPGDLPLQAVRVIYQAHVVDGELTFERDGSTDEARWVDLAEVPELQTVSLVDVGLRLYRERPKDGHLGRRA